jgi:predicted lipid-binding transport protein (Tim44 family)
MGYSRAPLLRSLLEQTMDIIFFAIVAALVLGRLYQVLGQDRGAEPPANRNISNYVAPLAPKSGEPNDIAASSESDAVDDTIVELRPRAYDGPGAAGIAAIVAVDRTFNPDSFLEGARGAYAMIVTAYGAGDEAALKPLVDQDVFEVYQGVMAQRRTDNAPKIEVARLSDAKIVDAELDGKIARVDVAFSADLAEGGDGLRGVDEIWTFERATDSRSPNWLLGAVQTK